MFLGQKTVSDRLSTGKTWREAIKAFADAPDFPPPGELFEWFRANFDGLSEDDFEFLAECLYDKKRALLAGRLLCDKPIPESLFEPLILAAIYEEDLNNCRVFIEPCGLTFGYRIVCEWLLAFIESGTEAEKAGAVRALYWASPEQARLRHEERADVLDREARALQPFRRRLRSKLLREFVECQDADLRRLIVNQIRLRYTDYRLVDWIKVRRARQVVRALHGHDDSRDLVPEADD